MRRPYSTAAFSLIYWTPVVNGRLIGNLIRFRAAYNSRVHQIRLLYSQWLHQLTYVNG